MNVFLSQDFLTVIHDMKFPGYQKFPFFAGIPGLFYRYAPSDDHICDHSVLVCEQITGGGITVGFWGDNSFLDIKNQTGSFYSGRYPGNLRKIFPYSCCNF